MLKSIVVILAVISAAQAGVVLGRAGASCTCAGMSYAIVLVNRIDLLRQQIDLLRERQQIDLMLSACEINVRNTTGMQKNRTPDP